jgi:lipoate---protein ligase
MPVGLIEIIVLLDLPIAIMIFVDNENTQDPRLNLAIEEYLLRNINLTEDILLLYTNEPSVIIGRNQNTLEEINHEYILNNGIHVVRRLSGGGAVYHDLGNLNYSFITGSGKENFNNFKKFTAPVIRALVDLGVNAELGGRNDILIDGRKISGNAQYLTGTRMVSHGTLLYNSDLSQVAEALQVKMSKIISKGIKSYRSRVVNIVEYLNQPMEMKDFRLHLLNSIMGNSMPTNAYHLSDTDWCEIWKLAENRYNTWEWNFGRSPAFSIHKLKRFPSGEIDARIDVKQGIITGIRFLGDYIGPAEVSELEERLLGVRYDKFHLFDALKDVHLANYFNGVSVDELVSFLY